MNGKGRSGATLVWSIYNGMGCVVHRQLNSLESQDVYAEAQI